MVSVKPKVGWERVDSELRVTSSKIIEVEGKMMSFPNAEFQFWDNITKQDVWNYYLSIWKWIAPYLHNRALGLNISLGKADEESKEEFVRTMEGRAPQWTTLFYTDRKNPKPGKSSKIDWLVCNDLPTLAYIVSLNCIDLHPWNSRITSPVVTDYIIVDLDPADGDFKKAIEVALVVKSFLDKHNLTGLVKTSGKTGIHIFIPCAEINFETEARSVGLNIASEIHNLIPDVATLETRKDKRNSKVYVDPSQNDFADRMACVYSLRPFVEPNVSTPVEWKEVNSKLNPSNFNIETIFQRLQKKGDLFKNIYDNKIRTANTAVLKKFL